MKKSFFRLVSKILLFNFLIFISLLSLHELGHAIFASILGCRAKAIIFDSSFPNPHTEIICERNLEILAMGGLIFTLPLSFLFKIIGKEGDFLFYVVFGLSLFLSISDFSYFPPLANLRPLMEFTGIALMVYGECRLGWLVGEEAYRKLI